jgi:hypothetical protein
MKAAAKKWIKFIASAVIVVVTLSLLQALLVPKYAVGTVEGAFIAEYYGEVKDHDVIFIGDCEVYESFVPAKLWEEYGISSYVRGNAQQLAWHSYYLLEETFKYEKPKVVVFNVLALKYGEPQSEEANRKVLDSMKLSDTKLDAIRASMTEGETLISYLFPILRYHSRFSELKASDFGAAFGVPQTNVSDSGYLMQTDIVPQTVPSSEGAPLMDYTLPSESMRYLDMMRELCEKNGAELVLVKAPTNSFKYYWYDEWEAQIDEYADKNGLKYYNFLECVDEIGLDFSRDTYDAGVHLNVFGAEKLTSYFGAILKDELGLQDTSSDAELSAFWQGKLEIYNERKNKG